MSRLVIRISLFVAVVVSMTFAGVAQTPVGEGADDRSVARDVQRGVAKDFAGRQACCLRADADELGCECV